MPTKNAPIALGQKDAAALPTKDDLSVKLDIKQPELSDLNSILAEKQATELTFDDLNNYDSSKSGLIFPHIVAMQLYDKVVLYGASPKDIYLVKV